MIKRFTALFIALLGLVFTMDQAWATPPYDLTYSGRFVDSHGAPVSGPVALNIEFFTAITGGAQLGSSFGYSSVVLSDGLFQITISLSPSDFNTIFSGSSATWLQVTDTTHNRVYPRQRMFAVPYALKVPIDSNLLDYDSSGRLTIKESTASGVGIISALNSSTEKISSAILPALVGDVTGSPGANTVTKIQNQPVSGVAPSSGQVLQWNGSAWTPSAIVGAAGGTVTSVSVSPPLSVTGNTGIAPTISLNAASFSSDGYLSANDWSIFNAKQAALSAATSSASGLLSSSDWISFNSKQAALGFSPLNKTGDTLSGTLAIGGGNALSFSPPGSINFVALKAPSSLSSSTSFSLPATDGTAGQMLATNGSGALSWVSQAVTYTDGQARGALSAMAPLGYNNGTGVFSLVAAGSGANGYLSSTDWLVFNSKGTGLAIATGAGLIGGPITLSGTLALDVSGVTAGSFVRGNISVDSYGRITSAASSAAIVDADIATSAAISETKLAGLLYTDARARLALSAAAPLTYDSTAGQVALARATGISHGYLASSDWVIINSSTTQWGTTVNGSIYRATGNLGINVTVPLSPLAVAGGAAIGSVYAGTYSAPANNLIVSGNLGVGTFSPRAMLDIDMGLSPTGYAMSYGGYGMGRGVLVNGYQANAENFKRYGDIVAIGGNQSSDLRMITMKPGGVYNVAMQIAASGNVGVGSTAPVGTLDVAGTLCLSGTCINTWPSTFNGFATGTGIAGGPLTTSGTISLAASGVTAGTYTHATVTVDSYGRIIAASGAAVDLTSEVGGVLPVASGGTGLTTGTAGGILFYAAANTMSASAELTANGVVLGGGAGAAPSTTAAGAAFNVLTVPSGGGAPAFGPIDLGQSGASITGTLGIANGGTGTSLLPTGGAGQYLQQTTLGGPVTVGPIAPADIAVGLGYTPLNKAGDSMSGTLALASGLTVNGGNVGIGTSSPGNMLGVAGSLAIGTYAGTTTPQANSLIVSNRIGVGTTSPNSSLEVNGTIRLTGSLQFNDGSMMSSAGNVGSGWTSNLNTTGDMNFNAGNIGSPKNIYFSPGNVAIGVFTSTGNMGIGGTTPKAKLDVTGNILASGSIGIGTTSPIGLLDVNGKLNVLAGGNVGIGSTAPTAPLDIENSVASGIGIVLGNSVTTGTSQMKYLGTGRSYTVGVGNASEATSGVGNKFFINDATAGAMRFVMDLNGNVGLGTTNPQATLHVAGSTAIFGTGEKATPAAATIRGANGVGTNIQGANLTIQAGNGTGAGGSGSIIFQTAASTTSGSTSNNMTTAMTIIKSGNIGIGTTVPNAGSFSGQAGANILQVNGPISSMRSGDVGYHLYNQGAVAEWGIHQPAHATGDYLNFSKYVSNVEYPYMTINTSGCVGIGTTSPANLLQVGSTTSAANQYITVDAAAAKESGVEWRSAGTSKWKLYRPASSNDLRLYDSQDRLTFQATTGNIGVSTTTPNAPLSFGASLGAKVFTYQGAATASYGMGIQASEQQFFIPTGAHYSFNAGGDIQASGTNELMRITGSGLGIGTTSPGTKLDVVAPNTIGIRALSGATSSFVSFGVGRTATEGQLGVAGQAGHFVGNSSPGDIILRSETATQRVMLSSGSGYAALIVLGNNVGIGSTSPASKLAVAGVIESTTGGFKFPDGSTMTTGVYGSTRSTGVSDGYLTSVDWLTFNSSAAQWLSTGSDIYRASGGLGIGRAPTAQLDIAAGAPNTAPMSYDTGGTREGFMVNHYANSADNMRRYTDLVALGLQDGTSGGSVMRFLTNPVGSSTAQEALRIASDGSVGIGTTAPAAKLHIGGVAGVDGIMFPDGSVQTSAALTGVNQWSTNGSAVVTSAASVGIGTSSPASVMEIDGQSVSATIGTQDLVTLHRGTNTGIWDNWAALSLGRYASNDTAPHSRLDIKLNDAARVSAESAVAPVLTLLGNGNVGVGTTAPGALFDVGQKLNVLSSGRVGIGTATPANKLDVNGGVAIGSYAGTNSATSGGLIVSGCVGIGTTAPASAMTVNGGAAIGSAYTGVSAPTDSLIVSGKVGIGSTAPVNALDVNGTVYAAGIRFPDGTLLTSGGGFGMSVGGVTNFSASDPINFIAGNVGGPSDIIFTQGGSERARFVSDSGNLGIGTTNPGSLLQVNGGAAIGYSSPQTAPAGGMIVSGNVGIGITAPVNMLDVNGGMAIGSYAGNSAATPNGLIVSGCVGIGTTNPQGALHVAGDTTVLGTGEGGLSPGAATIRGANGSGLDVVGANMTIQPGNGTGTAGSGAINFQTAPASTVSGYTANTMATAMSITNSGYVGIGTTKTDYHLSISDPGIGGNQLLITSQATQGGTAGMILRNMNYGMADGGIFSSFWGNSVTSTGSTGSQFISGMTFWVPRDHVAMGFRFNSNSGTTRMYIDSAYGCIGIGTTSPSELLTLSPAARAAMSFGAGLTAAPPTGATTSNGTKIRLYENQSASNLDYALGVNAGELWSTSNGTFTWYNNTSGTPTQRMIINSSGCVGIGTTVPANLLSVGTTSNFQVNTAGDISSVKGIGYSWPVAQGLNGTVLTNDGAGNLTWGQGSTSYWNSTDSAIYYNSGCVGIGTPQPGTMLEVAGQIKSTSGGFVFPDGSVMTSAASSMSGMSNSGDLSYTSTSGNIISSTGGYERMRIISNGNVGIGTFAPIGLLDVNRKLNVLANGSVGIGTTSPTAKLDVVAPGTWGLRVLSGGTGSGYNTSIGIGRATTDANFGVAAIAGNYSTSAAAGDVVIRTETAGQKLLLQTGTAAAALAINNGSIGIGTTNPIAPLDFGTALGNKLFLYPSSTSNSYGFGIQSSLLQMFTANTADIGFGTGSSTSFTELMRLKSSGNLGIATTSPGSKLQINGNASIGYSSFTTGPANGLAVGGCIGIGTTSPGQSLEIANASSTQMRLGAGGGTNSYDIGRSATDYLLHFYGNQSGYYGYSFGGTSGESMRISGAGLVGIGTTLPTSKLDVAGVIRSSVGGFQFPDGTVMTTAMDGANTDSIASTTDLNLIAGNSGVGDILFTDNNTERMRITSNGELGIGTASPQSTLDVAGNMAVGSYAGVTAAPVNGLIVSGCVGIGTTNPVGLLDVNQKITVLSNGNVGIGSSQPATTFDVVTNYNGGGMNYTGNVDHVRIALNNTKTGGRNYLVESAGGSSNWGQGKFHIVDATAGFSPRITMDLTGNVGIGTTSPAHLMHVYSTSATAATKFQSAPETYNIAATSSYWNYSPAGTAMLIYNSGNTASTTTGTLIDFNSMNSSNGSTNAFIGTVAGATGNGPANFVIGRRTGVSSWAESVRVDTNGNVGIGTTNPSYKFEVNSGTATGTRLVGSGHDGPVIRYENTSAIGGRTYHIGSTDSVSGAGNGFSIYDVTGSAARFLINPNGNVGIGTTSPAGKLDVAGTICLSGSNCISSWPAGSVTAIATGTGLSGGTITASGTLALADTTVVAGSYTRSNIVVDAQGRLTAASSGAAIDLSSADVSGTLAMSRGGLGLTSGTQGGMPYFAAPGAMASSGMLTANGILIGGGVSAAPSSTAALTDGQLLIGSTGSAPLPASLTAGTGITITPAAGAITIATTIDPSTRVSKAGDTMSGNLVFASGCVGIGTTAPLNNLDVNGSAAIGAYAGVSSAPSGGMIVSGNVGIGTTATSNNLNVVGSLCVNAAGGACAGNAAGTIYASAQAISAADLAEYMPVADVTLAPGDIVVAQPRPGQAGVVLVKSSHPEQTGVIGVVSTKPGLALGAQSAAARPIALAGRVPVNVTLAGGPIRAGDYLVPSSIPGKAMRAADAAAPGIIGVALSDYNGDPVPERSAADGIAHEKGHQVMLLVQLGAGSQSAVARLKAEAAELKLRADRAERDAAQLKSRTDQAERDAAQLKSRTDQAERDAAQTKSMLEHLLEELCAKDPTASYCQTDPLPHDGRDRL